MDYHDYIYYKNWVVHACDVGFTCYENKDSWHQDFKIFETIEDCFRYINTQVKYIKKDKGGISNGN
jgi:hypothetical protein